MLGCRNESVWYQREPTIAEILSDSMIKAMMRADRVDPVVLERDLRSIAQTMQSNTRIENDSPLSSPRRRGPIRRSTAMWQGQR
jgi:hypothetical protein